MLQHNHGHIVTMNSVLGLFGISGTVPYTSSKFGTIGLSEALNLEIRHSGNNNVYFTNVLPFQVDTDMFAGCKIRLVIIFYMDILCLVTLQ